MLRDLSLDTKKRYCGCSAGAAGGDAACTGGAGDGSSSDGTGPGAGPSAAQAAAANTPGGFAVGADGSYSVDGGGSFSDNADGSYSFTDKNNVTTNVAPGQSLEDALAANKDAIKRAEQEKELITRLQRTGKVSKALSEEEKAELESLLNPDYSKGRDRSKDVYGKGKDQQEDPFADRRTARDFERSIEMDEQFRTAMLDPEFNEYFRGKIAGMPTVGRSPTDLEREVYHQTGTIGERISEQPGRYVGGILGGLTFGPIGSLAGQMVGAHMQYDDKDVANMAADRAMKSGAIGKGLSVVGGMLTGNPYGAALGLAKNPVQEALMGKYTPADVLNYTPENIHTTETMAESQDRFGSFQNMPDEDSGSDRPVTQTLVEPNTDTFVTGGFPSRNRQFRSRYRRG